MRRWHNIVGLIAVLGVLFHAGLLVRHHVQMLTAHLAQQSLTSALGVICHATGTSGTLEDAERPDLPPPQNTTDCPICMGLGSAVAVLAERVVMRNVSHAISIRQEIIAEIITEALTHLRPPTRGPPSIV